jgi:hypothetical protein
MAMQLMCHPSQMTDQALAAGGDDHRIILVQNT